MVLPIPRKLSIVSNGGLDGRSLVPLLTAHRTPVSEDVRGRPAGLRVQKRKVIGLPRRAVNGDPPRSTLDSSQPVLPRDLCDPQ